MGGDLQNIRLFSIGGNAELSADRISPVDGMDFSAPVGVRPSRSVPDKVYEVDVAFDFDGVVTGVVG